MTSRRDFLKTSRLAALGLSLPVTRGLGLPPQTRIDIRRPPDGAFGETSDGIKRLAATPNHRWTAESITVTTEPLRDAVRIALSAPATPVRRLHLRWRSTIAGNLLILGETWEPRYGDVERQDTPLLEDPATTSTVTRHKLLRAHCSNDLRSQLDDGLFLMIFTRPRRPAETGGSHLR